jgi:hypothetical protein
MRKLVSCTLLIKTQGDFALNATVTKLALVARLQQATSSSVTLNLHSGALALKTLMETLRMKAPSLEAMINTAKDHQWCDAEKWRPDGFGKIAGAHQLILMPHYLYEDGHKYAMTRLWRASQKQPCLALVRENFDPRPRANTHWVLVSVVDGRFVTYHDCRENTVQKDMKVDDIRFFHGWERIMVTARNPK